MCFTLKDALGLDTPHPDCTEVNRKTEFHGDYSTCAIDLDFHDVGDHGSGADIGNIAEGM